MAHGVVQRIRLNDDGTIFTITLKNKDLTVKNVSSFTTRQIHIQSPAKVKVLVNATFVTDGTDGKITAEFVTGMTTHSNELGRWDIMAVMQKTGENYSSKTGHYFVDPVIGP